MFKLSLKDIGDWSCKVPKGVISKLIDNGIEGERLDKCITFVSWFSAVKYMYKDKELDGLYLSSHNKIRVVLGKNWVEEVLTPLKDLGIVDIGKEYSVGNHNRFYTISKEYLDNRWSTYRYTSRCSKLIYRRLYKLTLESIYRDELAIMQYEELLNVTAPTVEEVLEEGIRLINEGYSYKGKELAFSGDDRDNYYYVLDAIDQLKLYWDNGKLIEGSVYCGNYNCRRVATAFNLLPKWVRELFRFSGESVRGVDYSCLHPNIVGSMVGDGAITHNKVSEYLGIDRNVAKLEHLSFFNRPVWGVFVKIGKYYMRGMVDSKLYKYYKDNHPKLLKFVLDHKRKYGYKGLSRLLFSVETKIALEVCKKCRRLGIKCLYVYDGFYTTASNVYILKSVMEEALAKFNVNTYAVVE